MASVSVIIPAYGQAQWLAEAISSALNQQCLSEIIVVDDGSPDDSSEVAAKFGGIVRVIRKVNGGLSAARNTGILESRGEWLVFLDSDDCLPSDFVSSHLATIKRSTADVAFSGYFPIDTEGRRIGGAKFGGMLPGESALVGLLRGNAFPPHAAMTRRSSLARSGLFDPNLTSYEDWDFWLRLAYSGARFSPTVGLTVPYRQHVGSMSKNARRMFENGLRVLQKMENCVDLSHQGRRALVNARWGLRRGYLNSILSSPAGNREKLSSGITKLAKLTEATKLDPYIALAPTRQRLQMLVGFLRRRLSSKESAS